MLDALVASRPVSLRLQYSRTGFMSLLGHGLAGILLVYATSGHAARARNLVLDTTMVFIPDNAAESKPAREDERPIDERTLVVDVIPKGFQTVPIISEIPTGVPPVDASSRFDPRDYSGVGIEGGKASGTEMPNLPPGTTVVYMPAAVEELPELLHMPPLVYPELLRDAGVEGIVVLEFVVNADGSVEQSSIHVVKSPHPLFNESSIESLRHARFRPARVNGHAVRVLARLPLQFSITH